MKEKIKEYLLKRDFDKLLELGEPSKVVRALVSLSYDKTSEIAWRSIEAIGRIVAIVAKERAEFGKDLLRRLLWSIRDEAGGIGWSSPEIIGEIVRNDPERYRDIPKILWSFMDEEFLRKGILWAMGRIGEVSPELVEFALPFLRLIAKNDSDREMRFYASWTLCKVGEEYSGTERDEKKVLIYDDGVLKEMAFSELRTCKKSGGQRDKIPLSLPEQEIFHGEKQALSCPFCNSPLQRPGELKNGFADIIGGRCRCGALYAYDPSGRALGETLMDSLAILCKGDYNKAVSLEEGKDYLVKYFIYEPGLNRIVRTGSVSSRRMIFVKILI
ncbi:MAG: HEAT repeat domain-containing protein [Thermodesulfovibrionales bacterium]|nr:HEAT repeat domain-containing protein [Thermodesulfovibrionales bacterium]